MIVPCLKRVGNVLISVHPQEAKQKKAFLDAKKAEVRKRLEEQSAKKAKKGFMTPERKKKLRVILITTTFHA